MLTLAAFGGGVLVGPSRERSQRRPVELQKLAQAAARELPEGSRVEPGETLPDGSVGLGLGKEGQVAQGCQDPALDDLDADLDHDGTSVDDDGAPRGPRPYRRSWLLPTRSGPIPFSTTP